MIHINLSGAIGGYAVCGDRNGTLVQDADKANCTDCIRIYRDWVKSRAPGHSLEAEVRRACASVGLIW